MFHHLLCLLQPAETLPGHVPDIVPCHARSTMAAAITTTSNGPATGQICLKLVNVVLICIDVAACSLRKDEEDAISVSVRCDFLLT